MDKYKDIADLLTKQLNEELTSDELARLEAWTTESSANTKLLDRINDPENLDDDLKTVHPDNWKQTDNRIWSKVQSQISDHRGAVHRVHFLKTAWFRYAAAIIIFFGLGAYLWNTINYEDKLVQHTEPVPSKNYIQPGSDHAILTLSDGTEVELTPGTKYITESRNCYSKQERQTRIR